MRRCFYALRRQPNRYTRSGSHDQCKGERGVPKALQRIELEVRGIRRHYSALSSLFIWPPALGHKSLDSALLGECYPPRSTIRALGSFCNFEDFSIHSMSAAQCRRAIEISRCVSDHTGVGVDAAMLDAVNSRPSRGEWSRTFGGPTDQSEKARRCGVRVGHRLRTTSLFLRALTGVRPIEPDKFLGCQKAGDWQFGPKSDGFRCLAFKSGPSACEIRQTTYAPFRPESACFSPNVNHPAETFSTSAICAIFLRSGSTSSISYVA
jgi:hypothetical protein